jgi:coenzyme F420-reducing hydrogenase alpha subunit
LQAAVEATRWVAGFDFPRFERPYDFVALSRPDEYAMCEGQIRASDGLGISANNFERHFRETQVPHSTALQAVRSDTGRAYFLGPLARVNLNRAQLFPTARRLADEVGLEQPCRNVFKSIMARGIEIVHAYEEALSILKDYRPPRESRVKYEHRKGAGAAATEAPRGLLYHRYEIDENGLVTMANIVPPTSQNQGQMEDDLVHLLPALLSRGDKEVAAECERLVRSYDPCISCATHFLKVRVERRG